MAPMKVRLTGPVEVISLVPYLLGFHPTDSIVILAMRHDRPAAVARYDLPLTDDDRSEYTDSTRQLLHRLTPEGINGVLLIGYGLAEPVTAAFQASVPILTEFGIVPRQALRVADNRWWDLTCTNAECCPPQGTAFDPMSTVAAASATAAGIVALPHRAALVAQLAPIGGSAGTAVQDGTTQMADRLLQLADAAEAGATHRADATADPTAWLTTGLGAMLTAAGRDCVRDATESYRSGRVIDDEQVALLTVFLVLPEVLRAAARRSTGDDWQLTMWRDLMRRAAPNWVSGPANLLTISALRAGNHLLADCAIERSLDADPDDALTRLLHHLCGLDLSPETVAAVLQLLLDD